MTRLTKYRPITTIILLVAAMQLVSGYKLRCWLLCTDQTGIQTDYGADREVCRRYAQLRIDTDTANPDLLDGRERTGKLVSLFSACMADKGWTVPDGKGGAGGPVPIGTPAAAESRPAPAADARDERTPVIVTQTEATRMAEARTEKNYLSRQSECAFARHSAEHSSVAATRAEACDLECTTRRKENPSGKKPAACP